MKPYQFKTVNLASSTAQPNSSFSYSSTNTQSFYNGPQSITNNHMSANLAKPVNQNISVKAVSQEKRYQSQNQQVDIGKQSTNISSMKSKLDELLKQTEMLAERKNHHSVSKINNVKPNENVSKYSTNAPSAVSKKESSPQKLHTSYGQLPQNKPYLYNNTDKAQLSELNVNYSQKQTSLISNPHSNSQAQAKSNSYTSFNKSYQQPKVDTNASIQNGPRFQLPTIQNLNLSSFPSFKGNYDSQKSSRQPLQKPMSVLVAAKTQRQLNINNNKQKPIINTDRASAQVQTKQAALKSQSVPPQGEVSKQRPQSTYNQLNYYNDYTKLTLNSTTSSTVPVKKQQAPKPIQIPNNLSQCQYKLRQLDFQHRKIQQQLKETVQGKQYYRKQLSQQWRNNKKQKDDYEQQIKEIHQDYNNKINQLKNSIEIKDKKILNLINELAQAKVIPNSQNFEQKSKNIISENEKLTKIILQKDKEISNLKADLAQKDLKNQNIQDKIRALEDEVLALNNYKKQTMHSQMQNFDEILKVQLKSISEFKQMIERLNQKNNDLREKLIESNRKNQFLSNEQRILQLKHNSAMNGLQMSFAIDQSNKQNMISTLNKKIMTLEDKYKSSLSDIKTKDEFLRSHLVGRTDSMDVKQYIEGVLKKYAQNFGESKEQALKIELDKAKAKIELLEKYK